MKLLPVINLLVLFLMAGCSTTPTVYTPQNNYFYGSRSYKVQYASPPSISNPRLIITLLDSIRNQPAIGASLKIKSIASNVEADCITDRFGTCRFHLIDQFKLGTTPISYSGVYIFKVAVVSTFPITCECTISIAGDTFIPRAFEVQDHTARFFFGPSRTQATKQFVSKGELLQVSRVGGNYINVCFGGEDSLWLNASSGRLVYAMPSKGNACP